MEKKNEKNEKVKKEVETVSIEYPVNFREALAECYGTVPEDICIYAWLMGTLEDKIEEVMEEFSGFSFRDGEKV